MFLKDLYVKYKICEVQYVQRECKQSIGSCRNTNDNPGRTAPVDHMRILKCFSVGVGEGGILLYFCLHVGVVNSNVNM